eukprot:1779422-Rhodomonas_salina.2
MQMKIMKRRAALTERAVAQRWRCSCSSTSPTPPSSPPTRCPLPSAPRLLLPAAPSCTACAGL